MKSVKQVWNYFKSNFAPPADTEDKEETKPPLILSHEELWDESTLLLHVFTRSGADIDAIIATLLPYFKFYCWINITNGYCIALFHETPSFELLGELESNYPVRSEDSIDYFVHCDASIDFVKHFVASIPKLQCKSFEITKQEQATIADDESSSTERNSAEDDVYVCEPNLNSRDRSAYHTRIFEVWCRLISTSLASGDRKLLERAVNVVEQLTNKLIEQETQKVDTFASLCISLWKPLVKSSSELGVSVAILPMLQSLRLFQGAHGTQKDNVVLSAYIFALEFLLKHPLEKNMEALASLALIRTNSEELMSLILEYFIKVTTTKQIPVPQIIDTIMGGYLPIGFAKKACFVVLKDCPREELLMSTLAFIRDMERSVYENEELTAVLEFLVRSFKDHETIDNANSVLDSITKITKDVAPISECVVVHLLLPCFLKSRDSQVIELLVRRVLRSPHVGEATKARVVHVFCSLSHHLDHELAFKNICVVCDELGVYKWAIECLHVYAEHLASADSLQRVKSLTNWIGMLTAKYGPAEEVVQYCESVWYQCDNSTFFGLLAHDALEILVGTTLLEIYKQQGYIRLKGNHSLMFKVNSRPRLEQSTAMLASFHTFNLQSLWGNRPFSLDDILKELLWADYFRLCNLWNLHIENVTKETERAPWHHVASIVQSAAMPIIALHNSVRQKAITFAELEAAIPRREVYLQLIEALRDTSAKVAATTDLGECVETMETFRRIKVWLDAFLTVWIPLLPFRLDLSRFQHFMGVNEKGLTIKNANTEVSKLLVDANIQRILQVLDTVQQNSLLKALWASNTANKVKPVVATLFSATFPDFVDLVAKFVGGIQQHTITLENIEKFFRPLVDASTQDPQKILEGYCADAVMLINSFSTRKLSSSDLTAGLFDVCRYLKFLVHREIIAELLQCAKSLDLIPDGRHAEVKAASSMKYSTLSNFIQTTANIASLTEKLPATAHFKAFLVELGQCRETIDWLAGMKHTDLQHEIDILKSKGLGDNRLMSVLGDLSAVSGWCVQLGLISNNGRRERLHFGDFLARLIVPDSEWTKRIFASDQIRSVRTNARTIRCTIQDLRAGKLSISHTDLASQVLNSGTFVFYTAPSTSPFEKYGTVFAMHVAGLQQDSSLLSGVRKGKMDWPMFSELAKKMILAERNARITEFLAIYEQLRQLVVLYQELHKSYHFNFRNFRVTIDKAHFPGIPSKINDLKAHLQAWNSWLNEARVTHFSLNFLKNRELYFMIHCFETPDAEGRISTIQQLNAKIGCKRDVSFPVWRESVSEAEQQIGSVLRSKGTLDLNIQVGLRALGIYSTKVFTLHNVPKPLDISDLLPAFDQRWEGVCVFYSTRLVTSAQDSPWGDVLSMYLKMVRRFPQQHELLLCDTSTTEEEILLFFYRAARPFAQPPEPYTVVYPDTLHPSKQAIIRKLAATIPQSALLAILVPSSSSSFFCISTQPILLPPLAPSLVQTILMKYMVAKKLNISVVTSARSGEGKTHYIQQIAKDSSPVTFYSSTHLAQVVSNLSDLGGTVIYLAVSSTGSFDSHPSVTSWAEIDKFLFCLVVLGIITDQYNNIFYTKYDSLMLIEVSNGSTIVSPSQTFLSLLPKHLIATPAPALFNALVPPTWRDIFGARLELNSTQHPLDVICAAKFLNKSVPKLVESSSFSKQNEKFQQAVHQQLIDFVDYYFLRNAAKHTTAQPTQQTQPILTFGYDTKTKLRIMSTSLQPHNTTLTNYALSGKSTEDLTNFLHILFTKKIPLDPHFVLTGDNLLKLALLRTLVICEIPVIFMGETGSGKTKLVECFGQVAAMPVYTLDMHGGIGEAEVIDFINSAQARQTEPAILFFDEINTSPAGELIKEIVCDRSCRGVKLQQCFQVIAACNPLVMLSSPPTAPGTLSPFLMPSGPNANLKYNVRPIHATLQKYVWNFGIIDSTVELEYIQNIITRELRDSKYSRISAMLLPTVAAAQQISRAALEDRNDIVVPVSLRDVERCTRLARWLLDMTTKSQSPFSLPSIPNDIIAVVIALFVNYAFRFTSTKAREKFIQGLCAASNGTIQPEKFDDIMKRCTKAFIACFSLGKAIAPSVLLAENLLYLFCCSLNKIPLLMIGRPGTSKSLSMSILVQGLRGPSSQHEFLRQLPLIQPFSVQCSARTTSATISGCWQEAREFATRAGGDTIAVVLLDEVGLAQCSDDVPLKVLHSLLAENPPVIAFVGLSNWVLDASNMNRAICRICPTPTVEELSSTATELIHADPNNADVLRKSAKAFSDLCQVQKFASFFGLRDFYSFVHSLPRNMTIGGAVVHTANREFGGLSESEREEVVKIWRQAGISSHLSQVQELDLIHENLRNAKSRHLMVISHNEMGNHILFGLSHRQKDSTIAMPYQQKVKIIEGPLFEEDGTDHHIHILLHDIRRSMEDGDIVVLVNLELLYESLYEVLNKSYTQVGEVLYTRIVVGHHSESCLVHPNFKVVIVVDPLDAYHRLAPPFLNRFEKRTLDWSDVLRTSDKQIVANVTSWADKLCADVNSRLLAFSNVNPDTRRAIIPTSNTTSTPASNSTSSSTVLTLASRFILSIPSPFSFTSSPNNAPNTSNQSQQQQSQAPANDPKSLWTFAAQNLFYGYHWQYYASFVVAFIQKMRKFQQPADDLLRDVQDELLWMAKPEAIMRVLWALAVPSKSGGPSSVLSSFAERYMANCYCTSLHEFLQKQLHYWQLGIRLVVYTNSLALPTTEMQKIAAFISNEGTYCYLDISAISSQNMLQAKLDDFFKGDENTLFILSTPTSFRLVSYLIRECDKAPTSHPNAPLKHIILVCLFSHSSQQALCIDFTSWRSIFLDSLANNSPSDSFSSPPHTMTRSSFSDILATKSWVDLLDKDARIFEVIGTLYGVIGCVSLLEYSQPELVDKATGAVQWLVENRDTKYGLEMQMRHLLSDIRSGDANEWLFQCLEASLTENHGSLRTAISSYTAKQVSRLFCWLLTKLDTNHNLATFPTVLEKAYSAEQREAHSVWVAMLTPTVIEHTFGWDKGKLEPTITAHAKFPFSYIFIPRLLQLKDEATVLSHMRGSSVNIAMQTLIQTSFPVLHDIRTQELLLAHATDLSNSNSYIAFTECGDIVLAYLKVCHSRSSWTQIADIYACLWQGEHILSLLCTLSRCSISLRKVISESLQSKTNSDESLLMMLIPVCLSALRDGQDIKLTGELYSKYTTAFFTLQKLLLLLPERSTREEILKRNNVILQFLKERMVFHFYFDIVLPTGVASDKVTEFRRALDAFERAEDILRYRLASGSVEFEHKCLVLYIIPSIKLDGIESPRSQHILLECLQIPLILVNMDSAYVYLARNLLYDILDIIDPTSKTILLQNSLQVAIEAKETIDDFGCSLVIDYIQHKIVGANKALHTLYQLACHAARHMFSGDELVEYADGNVIYTRLQRIAYIKSFISEAVKFLDDDGIDLVATLLSLPPFAHQRGFRIYFLKLLYNNPNNGGESNMLNFLRRHHDSFPWVVSDLNIRVLSAVDSLPMHDMGLLYEQDYENARQSVVRASESQLNRFTDLILRTPQQQIAFVLAVHRLVMQYYLSQEYQNTWIESLAAAIQLIEQQLPSSVVHLLRRILQNPQGDEFFIHPAMDTQQVSAIQLIVHIACVAVCRGPEFLRQLVLQPTQQLNASFFPTMPDNAEAVLAGIQHALQITRLYRCGTCNEAFGVGDCGAANGVGRCARCGTPIGGLHHQMAAGVRDFGHARHEQGYNDHLNESPNQGYRTLDATSLRTIRVFMHASLFATKLLNIDRNYTRHSLALLFRRIREDVETVRERLQSNGEKNWELLHCLLFSISETPLMPYSRFITEDERTTWERNICLFLREQRETTGRLDALHAKLMHRIDLDKGATAQALEEIRGNFEHPDSYENIPKLLNLDNIYGSDDILEAFLRYLDTPKNTEAFPIVHNLFFKLVMEDLSILLELPKVLQFTGIIFRQFGGRLSLQDAQTRSVNHCLNALSARESSKLQSLFEAVCKVWNHVKGRVNRFECEAIEIPVLTRESPMILVLNHPSHAKILLEIIKATLFIQNSALQEIYNAATKMGDNAPGIVNLLTSGNKDDSNTIDESLCTPLTVDHDVSLYLIGSMDLPAELRTLLLRTVNYGPSWPLKYIQAIYLQDYILGKPYLKASELPIFLFLAENTNKLYSKQELSAIVPQSELTSEQKKIIQRELLSKEYANIALSQLLSAALVVKRVGTTSSSMNLLEFMEKVMVLKVQLPSVFKTVTVGNIYALQELLTSNTQPQISDYVPNQYKSPIDARLQSDVQKLAKFKLEVLRETLEEFVKSQLAVNEPSCKPSIPLKDWIAHISPLVDDEEEAERVQNFFPPSILVCHACAVA